MAKSRIIYLTSLMLLAITLIKIQSASTQEISAELPDRTENVGTYFEIKDSEYLNLVLKSSKEVRTVFESIPRMISLDIENVNGNTDLTDLVLMGLEPNKNYYKYEDSYKNMTVFVSSENGAYGWQQDLAQHHNIWIQEIKSTIFLPEDCGSYGNWDNDTLTCTLTQDLNESVEITKDNINLDCNHYGITGSGAGYGINIIYGSGISITNCNVNNFSYGIYLFYSNSNKLVDNNVSENYNGVVIIGSDNNILNNNTADLNKYHGIFNALSSNNNFAGNIMSNNFFNFAVSGANISHYANDIDTSNLVDGKPVYYLLSAENQTFDSSTNAGVFYCIDCNNVVVKDLVIRNNLYGVFFWNTHNSKIKDIIISDNGSGAGIGLSYSTNNIMINNTLSDMDYGILLLQYSNNNIVVNNTFSNNLYGIFTGSFDNKIYHNNFINNSHQAVVSGGGNNYFDNGYPDGGNYWSDYAGVDFFSGFAQGLFWSDGIGDTPYIFSGGQDNYPFMNESGWEISKEREVPLYTQVISPYPSDTETKLWAPLKYANGSANCGYTIADCGCALTSAVMTLRYYDVTNVDNLDVNPGTLNEWLNNNGGYFGASIDWLKVVEYSEYEVKYASKKSGNYEDNFALLDEYLNKDQPAIARERILSTKTGKYFDHFIVIDKKLADTYGVKDPTWYNTKKLNETDTDWTEKIRNYNNKFYGLRLFYPGDGIAMSALSVTLASPAEILVTDSWGRKLGKDPVSGIEYNTIPNGSYFTENIGDVSEELPPSDHENKALYIENPEDGEYEVKIIGTGSGNYEMGILACDQDGNSEHIIYEGETAINNIQEFEFGYSHETVRQVQLYRLVDIDIKPGSELNSINLESKGVMPVAVLSNRFFDAQEINIESILFSGANPAKWNIKDVDDDGDLDLVLHFETQSLNLISLDTEAVLTGKLNDGILIKGSDFVRIINNEK